MGDEPGMEEKVQTEGAPKTALYLRTGTAFRWRPVAQTAESSDVIRVIEEGDLKVIVLANAYDCGFAVCWPPGSRLVLDCFEQSWASATGTPQERLIGAFDQAGIKFVEHAPALIPGDADFPDAPPGATLLVAVCQGSRVHLAWIGGDYAVQTRGFEVQARTTPHTLWQKWKQENPDSDVEPEKIPNVLIRTIGSGAPDQGPPEIASFDLEPGDALVLLSKADIKGQGLTRNDASFAAAIHASPQQAASQLVNTAFETSDAPYAAAAVVRAESFELGPTLESLLRVYEPDPRHGEWLREWSTTQNALPVMFDMGGLLAMRPDGTIIGVDWDDPNHDPDEQTTPVMELAATIGAARLYPELAELMPRRTAAARDCPECHRFQQDGEPPGCPICWHIGWQPPTPPEWVFGQQHRLAPESNKSPKAASWWKRLLRSS